VPQTGGEVGGGGE